jgi:hypothetical protein
MSEGRDVSEGIDTYIPVAQLYTLRRTIIPGRMDRSP